jgi:hypothetical protein
LSRTTSLRRPICTEKVPGNTANVTVLLPVVERLRTRFGIARAFGNKMFQHGLDGRTLKSAHSLISTVSRNSMEYQNGQPALKRASARASRPQQRISKR